MPYAGSFSEIVIKLINTCPHLYAYRMQEIFGRSKIITFDNSRKMIGYPK